MTSQCHFLVIYSKEINLGIYKTASKRGGRGGACGREGGGGLGTIGDDKNKLKCEYCGGTRCTKDTCLDLYDHPQLRDAMVVIEEASNLVMAIPMLIQ